MITDTILHIDDQNWSCTSAGQPRGYIQPETLSELWFHTGTVCNLQCPFCLEGSKPADNRLGQPSFDDLQPIIDEALKLDVHWFSFTGGEPFVNKELVRILKYALEHRPCLVLSNGTLPLARRLQELLPLLQKPNPLRIRISLDAPNAEAHDVGRGAGNFILALDTLRALHNAGFGISVARLMLPEEDKDEVDNRYRLLFQQNRLPESLPIVAFPDFLNPGEHPEGIPEITQNCMTTYHTEASRASFMCAYSKMVVKKNGKMRVYACTLVDDDPDYDLGGTLTEAMRYRVMLRHHRCFSCFAHGASCSER